MGWGVYSEISSGVVWVRSLGVLSCVICWQAVVVVCLFFVFCAPGRVAGWVCLGVFPTWCSKVGADTGSICNHTSFNGHVFYFKLWVYVSRNVVLFFTYENFFSRCVTLANGSHMITHQQTSPILP